MKKKLLWITETAVMVAALVTLQFLTKPMGQLVTGTCVNAVLVIAALVGSLSCGVTVALVSPVLAFFLGIAPQILTVPAIMVGNTVFVVLHRLLADHTGTHIGKQLTAWILAAAAKFAALYAIVVWLICGIMAESLMAAGTLKAPMLQALTATFSWPQLITALTGGAVALIVFPVLRKALKRNS